MDTEAGAPAESLPALQLALLESGARPNCEKECSGKNTYGEGEAMKQHAWSHYWHEKKIDTIFGRMNYAERNSYIRKSYLDAFPVKDIATWFNISVNRVRQIIGDQNQEYRYQMRKLNPRPDIIKTEEIILK